MLADVQTLAPAAVDTTQVLGSQLASAALLAYLLKWLQRTDWVPYVTEHTRGINRALTGVMSLAATVGIGYNFDTTAGVLTITGLHLSSVAAGLFAWIQQWAFQQAASDIVTTRSIAADVQAGDVARPTGLPPAGTGSGT